MTPLVPRAERLSGRLSARQRRCQSSGCLGNCMRTRCVAVGGVIALLCRNTSTLRTGAFGAAPPQT